MRSLLKGFTAFGIFGLLAFANLSAAQTPTFYYQTYLNLDGNTATGCTVEVPDHPLGNPQYLHGVEVSLIVTVTNGVLVSAERFACIGNALISQGPDSGHPTYTLGGAFIEYRLPNIAITSQTTIGFAASTSPNFDIPSDVFFEDTSSQPILLAPLLRSGNSVPIPVSTPVLLLLIAIAAGLIAARYLRTPQDRRIGALALIVCLTGISGAVLSATKIILDGNGGSWNGVPVLAIDPVGDAPYPEIDLVRVFGVYQGDTLYLRLDLEKKPDSGTPSANTPPRITSDPVTTGAVGTAYSYQVEAEDDDGDILNYSLPESPTGMTIDSDGLVKWASPVSGAHNITVRVSDGQATDEQSYVLTVSIAPLVNTPPRITSDPVTTGAVGTAYSYQVEAEDDDGDALTYSLTESPTGMSIDSDGLITWTTPVLGTHNITVRVSDGQATDEQSYMLTISAASPPVIVINVSVTQPATGSVFTQSSAIPLRASAAITGGTVNKLEFFSGSALLGAGAFSSGEYGYEWSAAVGDYSVFARVTDNLSGIHDSLSVNIKVCGAPTLTFTSPIDGASMTAQGEWALAATASTVSGCGAITKVEFYNGSDLLYAATSAPYTYLWQNVPAGDYVLTAKAADSLGGTSEQNINVSVTAAVPMPEITLISPIDGSTYEAGNAVTLSASTNLPPTDVQSVEFFAGADRIAVGSLSGDQYTATWTAPAGSHAIFARLTDNADNTYDSSSVNITVNASCVPEVSLTSPTSGTTITVPGELVLTAQATVDVPCGAITKVEFYSGTQLLSATATAPYTYTWNNIPEGSYTLTAKAFSTTADNTSAAVQVTVEGEGSVAELNILSPTSDATINDVVTIVSGTFTYSPGAVIIANGKEAKIKEDGTFIIYDVPLQSGSNTLTVVLNTHEHDPVSKEVTVIGAGNPPMSVNLTPAKGVAPIETTLSLQLQPGNSFGEYCLALGYAKDGGSVEDAYALEDVGKRVGADEQASLRFTFPEAGEYTVHVQLQGLFPGGQCGVPVYTTTRTLMVDTPAKAIGDTLEVYFAMVKYLKLKQPDKALKYFTGDVRDRYQRVFDDLKEELPALADQLSAAQQTVLGGDIAELMVTTEIGGERQTTPVYLLRGSDGIWRIDSM
ncbi:MAG: hypothetical protein LBE75_01625 [Burkholderiales bacterium]|jgi:hypothetical protein|nr:hypothetical protein [Burkholderiales bacterium]